jgi:hypothetical protein
MPPTYRQRLRLEGGTLAAAGAVGTLILLAATAQARRAPVSTAVQWGALALLLAWLMPRSVRHAIAGSEPRSVRELGSGEGTPLWQLPAIVIALAALAALLIGWDGALRVTGGCVLVGLAQSVACAWQVAKEELASGRTYFRIPGSRIFRGTRLGYIEGR